MKNNKETLFLFALTIAMIIVMLVYISITMQGGHVETSKWLLAGGFGVWFGYNFYIRVKL